MGADDGETGTSEGAHTGEISPDPERAAKVGVTRATVEAAIGDLAASMAQPTEAEQASLMLDEMDEQMALFAGPVKSVAETIGDARRARGRPKGSSNKNSFRDVALRMGYRHPGLNLLAIANADPDELAAQLAKGYGRNAKGEVVHIGCTPVEAMQMIMKANAELLPYFEGKAAQQLDVNIRQLGVMMIGTMETERADDDQALDLTRVAKPE